MSTPSIPPVSGSAQVTLQGVSSGGGTSGTTNVPPGIMALPQGTLLRGNIVHIDPQSGTATLRTPKGDLTLKSDLPLERGNEVVIRLDTVSAGLKARIISVDGLTPKELGNLHPRPGSASPEIEDLLDIPDQATPQAAGKQPLPPRVAAPALPAAQEIIDVPILDTVEITPQQTPVLRAALLSRAPELPQLLRQLPTNIFISPQRLEAGAAFSVTVLTDSIQLPGNRQHALPATPPAPGNVPAGTAPAAISPSTPALATPAGNPFAALHPQPAVNRVITLPGGGYAPNPLLPPTPTGYTLTLKEGIAQPTSPTPVVAPLSAAPPASAAHPAAPVTTTTATPPLFSTAATPATPLATVATPVVTSAPLVQETAPPAIPAGTTALTQPLVNIPPAAVPANPTVIAATPPLLTPTSPTAATPQPEALIAQGMLPAQVIGTEQSGETVLKTPFGMLKVELTLPNGQRLVLPPETTLNLQLLALESEAPGMGGASPTSTTPATLSELSSHWSGLRDMATLLQQTHPLIAQNLLQNLIPHPGPRMARDMLFFLLGLKSGDASDWLDKKTVEALEQQNRGDLIRKFSAEFGALKQFYVESPNPNWQAVFVPVHYQGEWQQARLFVKKEKPESSRNQDDPASTRFIMEVDLSRLGPMQFDGFVKKHLQSTQFDLVIRSVMAFSPADQQAIRQIFTDASQMTGFKGGLSFQVGQPFPILPLEEILKPDRNVIA